MAVISNLTIRLGMDTAEFTSAIGRATGRAKRFLNELATQNMTFGMSGDRARYYKLQLSGATDEVLRQIDAQIRLKEELQKTAEIQQMGGDAAAKASRVTVTAVAHQEDAFKKLNSVLKLFLGGGAFAVFSHLANRISEATRSIAEMADKASRGEAASKTMTTTLFEAIPIVGRVIEAFDNLGNAIVSYRMTAVREMARAQKAIDDAMAKWDEAKSGGGSFLSAGSGESPEEKAIRGVNDAWREQIHKLQEARDALKSVDYKRYSETLADADKQFAALEESARRQIEAIQGSANAWDDVDRKLQEIKDAASIPSDISPMEKMLLDLESLGASSGQLRQANEIVEKYLHTQKEIAKAKQEQADAQKAIEESEKNWARMRKEIADEEAKIAEKDKRDAAAFIEQAKTAEERQADQMKRLRELLVLGNITPAQYGKIAASLNVREASKIELPSAKRFDSQDAWSSIIRDVYGKRDGAQDKIAKATEQTAKYTKEARDILDRNLRGADIAN